MIAFILALQLAATDPTTEAPPPIPPYEIRDANAGTTPFAGTDMWEAFHGEAGVARIVDDFVDRLLADRRIADIFKGPDIVRLRRMLKEQLCYILGGGCKYTGRDMAATHKDMGVRTADFNALVEQLQAAMDKEGVPFAAQNRLLAKLAPMYRDIVR